MAVPLESIGVVRARCDHIDVAPWSAQIEETTRPRLIRVGTGRRPGRWARLETLAWVFHMVPGDLQN